MSIAILALLTCSTTALKVTPAATEPVDMSSKKASPPLPSIKLAGQELHQSASTRMISDWAISFEVQADAVMKAFSMVGIAEIFDRDWFVALLMALRHDKVIVFWGCFLALAVHTVIAGLFGAVASSMISMTYLHFCASATYAFFAVLLFKQYQEADPDADIIAAGTEAAEGDCEGTQESIEGNSGSVDAKKMPEKSEDALGKGMKLFGACFVAMFIAEWGDRTQIAMIGAASSTPVLAVVIGSLGAFFVLTLSAVLVGVFLGNQKVSEKMVHGISALSFLVFACMSFSDGLDGDPVDMR